MIKPNKDLTPKEFEVSFQIKLAMNCLLKNDVAGARENLWAALRAIHSD